MSAPDTPTRIPLLPSNWGWPGRAFVALLTILVADLCLRVLAAPLPAPDTENLVFGALHVGDCWRGVAGACEKISYFALLQHIPTLLLLEAGVPTHGILQLLALASWCFYVLLFLDSARFFRTRPRAWVLFVLVMLVSPLAHYAQASFSEMWTAALLLLLFTSALRGRRPWLLGAIALLIGTSKETGPILLIGLAALLVWTQGPRESWKNTGVPIALGAAIAHSANASFNLFRMGSLANAFYGQEILVVPSVWMQLDFLAAAWLSPNGGLLFFWPLAFGLILAGIAASLRSGREADGPRGPTPAALSALCLFAISAGLARWHAPFGWISWGNRLLLPWMIPFCFLIVVDQGEEITRWLARAKRGWKILLTALGVLLALPQLLVAADPRFVMTQFVKSERCPEAPDFWADIEQYYVCIDAYAWPDAPALWLTLRWSDWGARSIFLACCLSGAIGLGFWLLGRPEERGPAEPPSLQASA